MHVVNVRRKNCIYLCTYVKNLLKSIFTLLHPTSFERTELIHVIVGITPMVTHMWPIELN